VTPLDCGGDDDTAHRGDDDTGHGCDPVVCD
jgi:hypothetical protein